MRREAWHSETRRDLVDLRRTGNRRRAAQETPGGTAAVSEMRQVNRALRVQLGLE